MFFLKGQSQFSKLQLIDSFFPHIFGPGRARLLGEYSTGFSGD